MKRKRSATSLEKFCQLKPLFLDRSEAERPTMTFRRGSELFSALKPPGQPSLFASKKTSLPPDDRGSRLCSFRRSANPRKKAFSVRSVDVRQPPREPQMLELQETVNAAKELFRQRMSRPLTNGECPTLRALVPRYGHLHLDEIRRLQLGLSRLHAGSPDQEEQPVVELLRMIDFFANMEASQLVESLYETCVRQFAAEALIIRKNESAEKIYIVLQGEVEIFNYEYNETLHKFQKTHLENLRAGQTFGDANFFTDGREETLNVRFLPVNSKLARYRSREKQQADFDFPQPRSLELPEAPSRPSAAGEADFPPRASELSSSSSDLLNIGKLLSHNACSLVNLESSRLNEDGFYVAPEPLRLIRSCYVKANVASFVLETKCNLYTSLAKNSELYTPIITALKNSLAFKSLKPKMILSLVNYARKVKVRFGEELFSARSRDDFYVMIYRGRIAQVALVGFPLAAGKPGFANFGRPSEQFYYNYFSGSKFHFENDLSKGKGGGSAAVKFETRRRFEVGSDFGIKALYTGNKSLNYREKLRPSELLISQSAETECLVISNEQARKLPHEIKILINFELERIYKP